MSCRLKIVKPMKPSSRIVKRRAYDAKAKEDEKNRRWYLSHFSKNRKGDISKDKELVILSNEDEQAKVNPDASTTASSVTLEQVSNLLVDG